MENRYKVSIRLMTFNHEPFIKEAMDGIMMQRTTFPFEVVIGDDFSIDKTLEMLNEYNSCSNVYINILPRKIGDDYWVKRQEKGRLYNFANVIENCTGDYIALLDGDDYWTDPYKLQKQVDFLEANSEYSFCFHQSNVLYADGSTKFMNDYLENRNISFYDLIKKNMIATGSCVYRKYDFHQNLPDFFYKVQAADWVLHLLSAQNGQVYYMKECMGVYRIHPGGLWSGLSNEDMVQKGVKILHQLNEAFNFKYNRKFKEAIIEREKRLIVPKVSSSVIYKVFNKVRKFLNL